MNLGKVEAIYEDRQSFWDRYTIVLKNPTNVNGRVLHQAFSLSADGKSRHWLYVFYNRDEQNGHLGRRIEFDKLPDEIKKAIEEELE